MNISSLLQFLRGLEDYKDLCQRISRGEKIPYPLRLPRAVRPALITALTQDLDRPIVILLPRVDRMHSLSEELPAWDPELTFLPFPDPNPLFYEKTSWSSRTIRRRATVLARLTEYGKTPPAFAQSPIKHSLVLAPTRATMTRTISPRDFRANSRLIHAEQTVKFEQLVELIVGIGYASANLVTEPGQFSRRGGILDVWPPALEQPVRIEFFGDEVDSLRHFDPSTQRSTQRIETVHVTPAREGLPKFYHEEWDQFLPPGDPLQGPIREPLLEFFIPRMKSTPHGLLDFLPENTLVLHYDRSAFEDEIGELEEQAISLRRDQVKAGELTQDAPISYLTLDEINETLESLQTIDLGMLTTFEEPGMGTFDAFSPGPRFGGQLRPLIAHLSQKLADHEAVVVVSRQAPRLAELWSESATPRSVQDVLDPEILPGDLHFVHGALSEGWILDLPDGDRMHLFTDAEIFGWARPRPRPRRPRVAAAPESAYADLNSGDWVVHIDYGIGLFQGLVERQLEGLKREFLLVEFDGGAQLFVPIHQADRISRYIGADGAHPSPSRLGTQIWAQTKRKARQAIEEIARDLLKLYAQRQTIKGYAFQADTPWQQELEASFPYVETDDQLRALSAVKHDMEMDRPMDRLICGDVGYGKTEVALRAAFKAIMDGKQVAMLVPTTVLAQQHFNTFRKRLSAFPVEVEMLSRFRTKSETTSILQKLVSGEVDIVIGTHRLLQKDVRFKDLGLLMIDEEQRFGVTHKEHLKQMRTEVDVLTLTATPIPRTLYLALTGARDISTIATPPEERLSIITQVGLYDPRIVRQAILRELDRGGQVFFVHNRVQTIETVRRRLERLVPEARFAVAHGQMPETTLSRVMEAFTAAEIDVLVSTSIIESGLDIPNANTLIVDRSDWFGLSQLYQLRGRVGRGASQGYAYFFHHPTLRTTQEALDRLATIAEHSQLGAGYTIAMRDLEMRGAGDVLGTRQHGHISAIGFHLYTRLLAMAVRKQKATLSTPVEVTPDLPRFVEILPVSIELPLPAALPSDYIPERGLRLQLYRRMAEVRTLTGIASMADELRDRFGAFPVEVDNLFYQLRIRLLAAQAGVEGVSMENGQILLRVPMEMDIQPLPEFGSGVRRSKRGVWITRAGDADWQSRLEKILTWMAELSKPNDKDRVIASPKTKS
jgi:transcription-repair coupling factor (superfamily II helicase)